MIEKLQSRWLDLTIREQWLVVVGSILLLVGVFYWSVWQPIAKHIIAQEKQVQNQQQTLAWLKENGKKVLAMQDVVSYSAETHGTLEGLVNRTASEHKIKIERLQPQEQSLNVWIDKVQFDDLLYWLATLQEKYGIDVQIIEIAREDLSPGLVKIRRLKINIHNKS
ncbi:MAG: type II secretion system protein GspM [Plesiomonas shigelloides]